MRLRASILGGGSWGTTVASLVARNVPAMIWARSAETVAEINASHSNERYLPGARLQPSLKATNSSCCRPASRCAFAVCKFTVKL